jgi:predicted 3-demethylubiquinone-9 3-methyltransferase (glyoxalase superfamily)
MKPINPFLWFSDQAEAAAHFYVSIFPNSKLGEVSRYGEGGPGPAGTVMVATFELCGQMFNALNGGPVFSITPAISFFVSVQTETEAQTLWDKLSDGGKVLMEFGEYPFSKKYGWLNDKYGVSWQIFTGEQGPKITPMLMFTGDVNGKAQAAMDFYTATFPNSKITFTAKYEPGTPDAGNIMHAVFTLNSQEFMAMESGLEHAFTFTEGISFVVSCDTQTEIDSFWNALSAHPEAEQCGWLKDQYGVSWQIIPSMLMDFLGHKNPAKAHSAMMAMMQMKKMDIAKFKEAIA